MLVALLAWLHYIIKVSSIHVSLLGTTAIWSPVRTKVIQPQLCHDEWNAANVKM